MSSPPKDGVPEADDGLAHAFEAVIPGATPVENACELLCGIALVAMIGLIGAEAFARNLFNVSLQITDEIGGYLLVAIAFLSLSVAEAHGTYHRVELVQARLTERGRLVSQIVFDTLALATAAVITWQLVRLCLNAWRAEDVAPTPLLTPLWMPQISMPIGMALICFTLVRTISLKIRRLRLEAGA